MRYSCFSVLNGRKLLSLILFVLLLPVALNSCSKLLQRDSTSVSRDVIFDGKSLSGLTANEVRIVVEQVAQIKQIQPQEAIIDATTNGVIPGLNGLDLDIEKTVERILQARTGETVDPIYQQIPPAITLVDYKKYPIFQGNSSKRQVTFIINVAWGNEYLQEMLDVLKEASAQATFFLVGRWVYANQEEAKMISAAGFEIASHGYSDAISMGQATKAVIEKDIALAAHTIETVCNTKPLYFSPHRGELSPLVLEAASAQNQQVIMWTIDTVDWKLPGVDTMIKKIVANAKGGSLILMHPTEQTAEFLRQVIPTLRNMGLEPVTLTELLSPVRVLKE